MTWHPYQLNPVMFGQLYEGFMADPDQFWGDLVFVKCFNCSLTVWWNVDVYIFLVRTWILNWACLNGIHFCLEYFVLTKVKTKFLPYTTAMHPSSSAFICLGAISVPD
jgi:hypothetical protein